MILNRPERRAVVSSLVVAVTMLAVLLSCSSCGTPSFNDRFLGSQFGAAAVESIAKKEFGVLVGKIDGKIQTTPLKDVVGKTKKLDKKLFELARILD